jgi:glycosyltransferase involved in cell wall biosynthesis
MNILLFSRICAKTGVGNHIKQLSTELVEQGHHVVVVSGTNEIEIGGDFYLIPTPSVNPKVMISDIRKIRKIIVDNKIDVVHCHHRMAAVYMRLYRLFWKIPVVYTLHLADIPYDFIHRKMTFSGDAAIGVSTDVSRFW